MEKVARDPGTVESDAVDTVGSRVAADTLSAALVALVVSWWLGLEQVVPGVVILAGASWLWRRGELRFPPEAWVWTLLGVWSLTSATALGGPSDVLLFVRGEAHLVIGLGAYLVALSVRPAGAAFARFLKTCMVFLGVVMSTMLFQPSGTLPARFPSLISMLWPGIETSSGFVNDFVLSRGLATPYGISLVPGFWRQSSFFLYQGGLTTALLVLQGWFLVARHRLRGTWHQFVPAALAVGLVLGPFTGSRSGLALAWGVLLALLFWSLAAGKPWRRGATRGIVGVLLFAALLAVIPIGDGTSLEHGAIWERVVTSFRIDSFIDRFEVYELTLERLGERPWTGWGIQGRPGVRSRYLRLGTHSEWLNVAYRFGYVGLGLFVVAGALYGLGLVRSRRRPERPAVLLTLAALAATGLVRTFQWDLNVFWLVAAFLGTAKALLTASAQPGASGRAVGGPDESRITMMGARLDAMTMTELHRYIGAAVAGGRKIVIGHQNLHGIYLLQRERAMQTFSARADRVFFDGMALIYLARFLGHEVGPRHRVTYADWIGPLARECVTRGWRLFHLGGRPGVGERAAAILTASHPGLEMESHSGYFEQSAGDGVLRAIAEFRPDVLMVGMGMPRQEAWVTAHRDAIEARAILTCGACMDYVAGAAATPPRWAGRIGLEWLFRLIAEPRRLAHRYLVEPWSVAWLFLDEWLFPDRRGARRFENP